MLITILIIVVLLIAALIGLYAAYHKVCYSPLKTMSETESPKVITNHPYHEKARENVRTLAETPCIFVHTRSFDGLRLSARYYEGQEDKPLCLCFHGYRGSAFRDYSAIGLYLIRQGYNVLIVDERAHWRSQGHTITYGINERRDVLSWINYCKKRFGQDIPMLVFGISMGGATVLMASGLELPDNVKGIIADCPYNVPKDIINHVCRKVHLNPTICWPIIRLSSIIYGRFNIMETSAEEAVKHATKPILILHGEADGFVPMHMSKEVQEANPELVEWHSFPEAGHGLSMYYDEERYTSIMNDFIERCLGEKAPEAEDAPAVEEASESETSPEGENVSE